MNEEEKKAINDLKRTVELYEAKPIDKISVEFDEFDYKIVKIVLNLIKKLQNENEEVKSKNKTLEELLQGNLYELYKYYKELAGTYQGNSIPVQKVKDIMKYMQKKYNKLDEQVDEYINDDNKDLPKYYENKEKIGTMQTLGWFIGTLQELLEK